MVSNSPTRDQQLNQLAGWRTTWECRNCQVRFGFFQSRLRELEVNIETLFTRAGKNPIFFAEAIGFLV
jgi:hypothetical protein